MGQGKGALRRRWRALGVGLVKALRADARLGPDTQRKIATGRL